LGKSELKNDYYDTKIILFQVGNKDIQFVIDVRKVNIECLFPFLTSKRITKVGQNIKYDICVIYTNYNIKLNCVYDTMLASQILSTGLELKHGLYEITERYLNYRPDRNLSLFMPPITKTIRTTFNLSTPISEAQYAYAALDVELTHKLYEVTRKLLIQNNLYRTAIFENFYVLVLADMELQGIPFDREAWLVLADKVGEKIELANTKLKEYGNIN